MFSAFVGENEGLKRKQRKQRENMPEDRLTTSCCWGRVSKVFFSYRFLRQGEITSSYFSTLFSLNWSTKKKKKKKESGSSHERNCGIWSTVLLSLSLFQKMNQRVIKRKKPESQSIWHGNWKLSKGGKGTEITDDGDEESSARDSNPKSSFCKKNKQCNVQNFDCVQQITLNCKLFPSG